MNEYKAELKPCPFCGGQAKLLHGRPNQQKAGRRVAFVQCRECKAKAMTFDQLAYEAWRDVVEDATEAWNRRAYET